MGKTRVSAGLAALVLAAVGAVAGSGSAAAAPGGSVVVVHGSSAGLTVIHGRVRAGLVRFVVDTANDAGSDVAMFAPAPGKGPQAVLADLGEEFAQDPATAAKGTRDLVADSRFYGWPVSSRARR